MRASSSLRVRAAVGIGVLLIFGGVGRRQAAVALTPESPKVKQAIEKGVKFLESKAADDRRVGARALVGLVLLKNHADAKHPCIQEAVAAIQSAVKGREPAAVGLDIYSGGLAVIFLVTLDSSRYAAEITCLLEFLKTKQKAHGGWGYPDKPTGDTSMTQYGVLSAWEATQAGCKVSQDAIEAVTIWLLKTQDPSGGFGYQGNLAPGTALVKQTEVRHSMVAAGAGSLYICADLLGLTPRAEKRDENLPSALKEVKAKQPPPAAPNLKRNIDPRRVREAESRGNRWLGSHHNMRLKDWWTYYYLYAYERYASFRELAEGRTDKEPRWYTEGAQFLIRNQAEDGSWITKDSPSSKTADTAFATLFLLRSSKKSIEKAYGYGESTLVAARGLPKETTNVSVARGKVLPVPQWASAAELLPILGKPDDAAFEQGIAALAELPSREAGILAAKHADVLRRLVADRWPQARIAAVRALGNSGNLDQAPALIYALGDPDMDVAYEACEALRRLTRSPGAGLLGRPLTEARRTEEIRHWKDWYLTVRPDAELDN
ncbi:MAG: HEAT repeat domain-containing protein [Thermoguttaceae bacterium]|jgi:hypothetical protein